MWDHGVTGMDLKCQSGLLFKESGLGWVEFFHYKTIPDIKFILAMKFLVFYL